MIAFLRLRPPLSEHTQSESKMLKRYASGASCAVELGVAEGTSAWELRQVIDPGGALHLIDPHRGRFGMSFAGRVARRLVNRDGRAQVHWRRQLSHEAVEGWREQIDFLFIDADHSYEGVSRDWRDWARHVAPGGHVAFHDAQLVEGWTSPQTGPVRLLAEIEGDRDWEKIDAVDTTVVLRRRADVSPATPE